MTDEHDKEGNSSAVTETITPDPQVSDEGWRGANFSMGYLIIFGALVLFVILAWKIFTAKIPNNPAIDTNLSAYLIQHYGHLVLGIISAFFLTFVGMRLIGKAGKGIQTIIPPDDRSILEPLIKEGKKEGIDQYIRLSSLLGGFTGTFQKIGFTGLPLATATITLIFSVLSFFEPGPIGDSEFLELAKLTLGAFIGSFVQKGTDIVATLHEESRGSPPNPSPPNPSQNG